MPRPVAPGSWARSGLGLPASPVRGLAAAEALFAKRPRGREGLSGRERPSQLGFDELVVSLFFGSFDRGDIWSAARPPVSVRVAGVYSHGLSYQMHPIPDANFVLAVERRQFAVAGMKNRTDNVATGYGGGRPRIMGCGGQGRRVRGPGRCTYGRDAPAPRPIPDPECEITGRPLGH